MKTRGADMAGNGSAPDAPACLYSGKVMHARMLPRPHRFTYSVFSLMIDLDRLEEAGRMTRLLSVDRPGLVSFHQADHLEGREPTLRAQVERQLREAGLADRPHRICLVSFPRILGFVFNPLSVYYCWDDEGRLIALIYEVRNTFGGRHTYVCPVLDGEVGPAGVSQSADKEFHVSPFLAMDKRYHFRMLPPGEDVRWRILETGPEGPVLSATFSGRQKPLSGLSLAGLLARMPWMTLKVYLGIHVEAARLWLKGVPFYGMTPHHPVRPADSGGQPPQAIAQTEKPSSLADLAA